MLLTAELVGRLQQPPAELAEAGHLLVEVVVEDVAVYQLRPEPEIEQFGSGWSHLL